MDKILDYTPGQWARGIKCVTRTESFFQDISPAIRLCRGIDSGSPCPNRRGGRVEPAGKLWKDCPVWRGKNARFRRQVVPGDVLTLECELVEQHGPVGIGKATAWVDGVRAANAELTFVITDA